MAKNFKVPFLAVVNLGLAQFMSEIYCLQKVDELLSCARSEMIKTKKERCRSEKVEFFPKIYKKCTEGGKFDFSCTFFTHIDDDLTSSLDEHAYAIYC